MLSHSGREAACRHVVECIEDPYELRLIKDNAFQPGKNYLCEEPFSDVLSPSQPIDLTNMVIAVPQHLSYHRPLPSIGILFLESLSSEIMNEVLPLN
jgi:hypothetical protein